MISSVIPNWTTNNPAFLLEIRNIYNKDFVNFPIFVNIGNQSGVNNFDSSIIFNYTNNYKNLAFYSQGEILDTEVELWDVLNKQAQLWVRVPLIKANSTTYVTLQIDENQINDKVNELGSAYDVWLSSFRGVYHFSQDPSPGSLKDSTVYSLNLTTYNMDESNLVDCYNEEGKYIGKGLEFNNGVTDEILTSASQDFSALTARFTIFGLHKWNELGLDSATGVFIGTSASGDIQALARYSTTSYFSLAVSGDAIQSSYSINTTESKVVFTINENGVLYFDFNGILDYVTNTVTFSDLSTSFLRVGNTAVGSTADFRGVMKNLFIANRVFDQLDCQFWTKNLHDKLIIYRG